MLIPPGIMVSRTMSSFSEWMLPTIEGMVGIFHSHPNSSSRPSAQDKRLFSQKGGINIIAGYPFELKNVSAYIGSGKEVPFKVVD
ncbi:MAG: Mov34/MPN/PAD-1 family protein [Candidatus Micrarchaeota archaeon]|nr:Mov34/MPN/PAD-1 family protein [Candidatus Micrarchaeota archaeon]